MTKKRLLALLIAVLMLVALFSACNTDTDDPGDDTNVNDNNDNNNDDNNNDDNTPVDTDPLTMTYMGREGHQWTYTLEEAIQRGFESYKYYNQKMLEEQNLICEVTAIDGDSYKTTLSGHLAAGSLYDCFLSDGYMDADVMVASIENGLLANINEVIEYSDGTFSGFVVDGGELQYLKAWSTAPDGEWYYVKCADGNGTSFNFSTTEADYINSWPMHTWYQPNIRVDWLEKCGLSMPTTTEQFLEALVAFQDNDTNENGVKDERAYLNIAMSTGEAVFSNGVAGWFGLPRANFAMNPVTGALENAVEGETYTQFVEYMNELYSAGVALTGEGGNWSAGANLAGNTCAVQIQYPDGLLTTSTGDDNAQYEPMPIIQAVEGVKPVIVGQSVTTANNGMSFSAKSDYEASARYLDWLYGQTFYILLSYGMEGYTWDYNEDGTIKKYTVGIDITEDENYSYGNLWSYAPWCLCPQIQAGFIWDFVVAEYSSVQEALDAGEPYTRNMQTLEMWKEAYAQYNWTDISPLNRFYTYLNDYGTENINFKLNVNFTTLATNEEAEISGLYKTELDTYLAEMTTGYIVGQKSVDTYETDLQYAYDNLHMQDYMDSLQARINRYLVAMGRDAVE